MSLDVYLTCPHCGSTVYERNMTHNLAPMANDAGIYEHLWRPEELGIRNAASLVSPLKAGLALLRSDPARFRKFNPDNGWGDYEGLVDFVADYVAACEKHSTALVEASR